MADTSINKLLAFLLGGQSTPEVDTLKRQLADAIAKAELPAPPPLNYDRQVSELKNRYQRFQSAHKFSPGQLVKWKPGLRNRFWPQENQPGIVLDVFETPIYDSKEGAASAYFGEPLNIRIAYFNEATNEFHAFCFDSRRFEPIEL